MKRTNMAAAGAATSRGPFVAALIVLSVLCMTAATFAAPGASKHVPNRLLVGLRPMVSPAQVGTLGVKSDGKITRALAGGGVLVLDYPVGTDMGRALAEILGSPGVAFVEPDTMMYPTLVPNDPKYPEQYHWPVIRAPEGWGVATGGADVVIAIVDTGCDMDHPDLIGRYYVNPGEIPGNGFDDDGNGFADDVSGWDFQNDIPDANPEPDGADDDGNGEPTIRSVMGHWWRASPAPPATTAGVSRA